MPSNVVADVVSNAEVVINWSPSTDDVGVAGYRVQLTPGGVSLVSGTSFRKSGLTPGAYYYVGINAYDAAGNYSSQTKWVRFRMAAGGTTPGGAVSDTGVPSTPGNVAVAVTSSTEARITWSPSTDNVGVVGYRVQFSPIGGTEVAAGTSLTKTGFAPGGQYHVSVSAYDAAGNYSVQSAWVPFTMPTSGSTPQPETPPPPPAPVGGFTAVPLTIHELLPQGVAGIARQNAPASFGIPLKDSDNIKAVSQLGLRDAPAWQFRVLRRYPSGNIQWVQVDTLASVGAGGSVEYQLVTGGGNSAGSNLASDTGSTIVIDTGKATFTVSKSAFNLIDSARVGAATLVRGGHDGGVRVRDLAGGVWSSRFDAPVVTLEENGPVKAVVKAVGRLRNASGLPFQMGYTVRMIFFKDQSSARVNLTMRNAYDATRRRVAVGSIDLVQPTALGAGKTWTLATTTGDRSGRLDTGHVWLLQGYTLNAATFETAGWKDTTYSSLPVRETDIGVKIATELSVIKPHGTDKTNDYARGWGELRDASGAGVTLAYKDLDALFPGAIEFGADGTATASMYSDRNPDKPYVFDWAAHESRDFLFDFHAAAVDNEAVNAQIQLPLFGRAPFAQYRDSGGFLGETRIATAAEQSQAYAAAGRSGFAIPNLKRVMIRAFSSGSPDNQKDYMLGNQIDYVRLGHGGQMLNAIQRSLYMADQFPWHSDDFDFGTKPNMYYMTADRSAGPPVNGGMAQHETDFEHEWVAGMYVGYWMTGDERIREAILEMHESLYNRYGPSFDGNIFERLGMSAARMAAWSWMFTGEQRYLEKLNRYMIYMINTIDLYPAKPNFGRSADRGWIISYLGNYPIGQYAHSLFATNYFPTVLSDILKALPRDHVFRSATYPGAAYGKEDVADVLLGVSYWTYKEAYTYPTAPYPQAAGKPWIAYEYFVNNYPAHDTGMGRIYDTGAAGAWGYELSGDADFLRLTARHAIFRDMENGFLSNSEIHNLRALWNVIHPQRTVVQQVPVTARYNADGSWTVGWVAPPNAKRYQLKYSNRQIVANLDFDKYLGTYKYDNTRYAPFWGASNVPQEPVPAPAGTQQQMTLTGLSCGTSCKFALRAFDQDDIR